MAFSSTRETEHEISAILAHELAHLSQRHFARQVDSSKKANLASMAGLLAGLILMSTSGSDAGMAAITGAQAYGRNQLLKYSRDREKEADRIGIYTLAEADMDPRGHGVHVRAAAAGKPVTTPASASRSSCVPTRYPDPGFPMLTTRPDSTRRRLFHCSSTIS